MESVRLHLSSTSGDEESSAMDTTMNDSSNQVQPQVVTATPQLSSGTAPSPPPQTIAPVQTASTPSTVVTNTQKTATSGTAKPRRIKQTDSVLSRAGLPAKSSSATNSSDHLHLVSKKNPLHPEYVCKGGPITSAICSTNLGACATTSAVLSQFVENSAPGTDTFRPASPIRLAQAIAALEVYGPTTTAADETLMPSASLVSKDNLAPAIVKIAAQCAHIRNALKQMDTNIPYIFGLTTWGVSDAEVRVALGIAKKSIEAKEKPPTRTLLFMAEAVTKWTGPITGESVHLVQDVSYMPSKVSEALNDAQFKMYETRIILVVDGDVPTGFSVLDVLPTKTRSAAYSIFITCGPHGIGSSKIWMNQLMDLAIDLKANGNTKHGKVSSIADIGDGWTAFTVLGHKPSLPNRILPEYRVLEFFEALQVDSTFNDCPQVVIVKERKRKNEAAAGTYRKYDKK